MIARWRAYLAKQKPWVRRTELALLLLFTLMLGAFVYSLCGGQIGSAPGLPANLQQKHYGITPRF